MAGTHCCATVTSDDSAKMLYVRWCKEHLWNICVLQIIHLSNLVCIILKEHSRSWENNSSLACQEILLSWHPKGFMTMFTAAHHWPLSYASWIQSDSSRLILKLCLTCLFFPSRLPTKILHAFLTSPFRAACYVHLIFLDLMPLITLGK
jgi:hypothetical protein